MDLSSLSPGSHAVKSGISSPEGRLASVNAGRQVRARVDHGYTIGPISLVNSERFPSRLSHMCGYSLFAP